MWMGLAEKAGAALGLGYQAGKGIRGGQRGLGLLALGWGVTKEKQGWGRLGVLGWDGGCSRGVRVMVGSRGIKGDRNVPAEDWEVMED